MSILVNSRTRVLVQGITGEAGSFHTRRMLDYGTRVVAGVTPGRGGETHLDVPVFDTVREAVERTGADATVVFVPAPHAADAVLEAADACLRLVVCITEHIPVRDMARVRALLKASPASSTTLIGPNCPGVITPGECLLGIMPGYIHSPARPAVAGVGVVSRSGTLTYEAVWQLTAKGIGQSTCVGIGGDPILGSSFADILALFERDDDTRLVVLIGEIGGSAEQDAASLLRSSFSKPVVAFVAGRSAPFDTRMGHAGAIVSAGSETAAAKIDALRAAGVTVVDNPARIGETVASLLVGKGPT